MFTQSHLRCRRGETRTKETSRNPGEDAKREQAIVSRLNAKEKNAPVKDRALFQVVSEPLE